MYPLLWAALAFAAGVQAAILHPRTAAFWMLAAGLLLTAISLLAARAPGLSAAKSRLKRSEPPSPPCGRRSQVEGREIPKGGPLARERSPASAASRSHWRTCQRPTGAGGLKETRPCLPSIVFLLFACALTGSLRARSVLRAFARPGPLMQAWQAAGCAPRQKYWIEGQLIALPTPALHSIRIQVRVDRFDGRTVPGGRGAWLYVTQQHAQLNANEPVALMQRLRPGMRLRTRLRLKPVAAYYDPGVADFDRNARAQAVDLVGSVHFQEIEWLAPPKAVNGFSRLQWDVALWRWRSFARLSAALDRLIPVSVDSDLNAAAHSMLLADGSRLSPRLRRSFQAAGAYHLLVVAGLHLGLFCVGLLLIGRWLRLPRWLQWLLPLLGAMVYLSMIPVRTPTLRAILMLAVYAAGRFWYRQRQALNTASFAALVLLFAHPMDLLDAGWQLSIGAALLLGGVALPLIERFIDPWMRACSSLENVSYDLAFPPRLTQFRLELRMLATRLSYFWRPLGWRALPSVLLLLLRVSEGLLITLILQLGLMPILISDFHQAEPWSLLANALAIPLALLWLTLLWPAMLLNTIWTRLVFSPYVLRLPLFCGNLLLHLVARLATWPGSNLYVPSSPAPVLLVFAAAAAVWFWAAMYGRLRQVLMAFAAVALSVALLLWNPFPPRLPAGLSASFIDVGQGDSILVAFPDHRTLLVDAGPRQGDFDTGAEVVAPFLWSLGLRRLDAVLLTHAHNDHMGGMPFILRAFRPHELWVSQTLPPIPEVARLLALAARRHITLRRVRVSARFLVGKTQLQVLAPAPGYRAGLVARNADSLVIRLLAGRDSMLLEGDAESAAERAMVAERLPLTSVLLKAGHHGSRTSSTPAFLAKVRPRVAIISDGRGNSYGHPSPEVVQRFAAMGTRLYRTDQAGAIQCRFGENRLHVLLLDPPWSLPRQ